MSMGKRKPRIPVISETSDTVTIEASKTMALVNEDVMITVDAGDAVIDSVQFFNGYEFWDEDGPDEDNPSMYTAYASFDEVGSHSVFARVMLEDEENGSQPTRFGSQRQQAVKLDRLQSRRSTVMRHYLPRLNREKSYPSNTVRPSMQTITG